jgi:hypothetical protein
MSESKDLRSLVAALETLHERCPRLARACYWAGTSCIAAEELHHRRSFDLDFHTRRAMVDVRPILAELHGACGESFELLQAPDEFGSGFRGILTLDSGESVAIEVRSSYQDTKPWELVAATLVPAFRRITLRRYVEDKVQCIVERAEARDLVDLRATLTLRPELEGFIRQAVGDQDALLLSERLLSWDDAAIRRDLASYEDVEPLDASGMRDLLLRWLKEANG